MTFLNPAFLWAAFAISVPVIVHFFNFRRPKKILFSNIEIVREVKKSVVRRVKLRQLLILAARCLAILSLVLLFANPVIIAENSAATGSGRNSVVIMIDNSYSMTAGNEKGDYFHQSRTLADAIIGNHSRDDEFLVMTTSDIRLNQDFASREDAIEDLRMTKIRQNVMNWSEILKLSPEIFSRSSFNKTLYFLSDFQESTVMADSSAGKNSMPGLRVNMIPLASREQKNIYIEDHGLETRIIEPGKAVTLALSLINDGREDINDLKIRVILENIPVATSTDTIAAGQKLSRKISFTPPRAGWNSGYIAIDDNPVDFDNRRYFSFYVPENERVLVVEGESSLPVKILYGQLLNQFRPDFISHKEFAKARLEEYQFIVLLGINEISSGLEEQLDFHLKSGKGILFFPGSEISKDEINRFLGNQKIGSFGDFVTSETGFSADQVSLDHPVFEDVFRQKGTGAKFDPPRIFKYYRFDQSNEIVQNMVIGLSNGDPILLESNPGSGQVFLFTLFPEDSWTDFHYKAIFAPLMLRLSLLMNRSSKVEQNHLLGNFQVRRIKTRNQSQIRLLKSDSTEILPLQEPDEGFMVLRFDRLESDNVMGVTEGNYELTQDGNLLEKISFNIPDEESKLSAMSREDLQERWLEMGQTAIQTIEPDAGQIASEIQYQGTGYPLWKYFLIAALAFLLIEVMLLRMKETA